MIHVQVVAVSRIKLPWAEDAANDYAGRLRSYCKLDVMEVKEERLPAGGATLGEVARILEKEAERIRARLGSARVILAMDREGTAVDSPGLARLISKECGRGTLAFLVGGPLGLGPEIKSAAHHVLSFSKMTFPHDLFRVMLLEQLYRAFTLMKGHPYHR